MVLWLIGPEYDEMATLKANSTTQSSLKPSNKQFPQTHQEFQVSNSGEQIIMHVYYNNLSTERARGFLFCVN